jgi:HK97 family phage major capsid protein
LNAKSVLFGDFESAYVTRTVEGGTMMRLTERYADYLQVGFFAYERIDGQVQDTGAYKALTLA